MRAEARALGWPSPRALLADAARPRPGRAGRRGRGAAARDRGARRWTRRRRRRPPPASTSRACTAPRGPTRCCPPTPSPHLRDAPRRASASPDAGFALDAAPRAGKSPRAFCAAIAVPADVHLVVAPRGGLADLEALFHEAGHAIHLAHRDPRRAVRGPPPHRPRRRRGARLRARGAAPPTAIDDARLAAHRDALARLRTRHLAALAPARPRPPRRRPAPGAARALRAPDGDRDRPDVAQRAVARQRRPAALHRRLPARAGARAPAQRADCSRRR